MRIYIVILLSIFTISCKAQNETEYLTKSQIEKDLAIFDEILQNKSSYQGLNGYSYKKDFEEYLNKVSEKQITKFDFEMFLSKTLGKIGDRHSYIKGDRLRNSIYFPFAFAPYKDKVIVINYNRTEKEYNFLNKDFPYLKSINKIPIEELLPKIFPEDVLAPKLSCSIRAIRELRDIENIYKKLNIDLPNPISITLTNENGFEKKLSIELITKRRPRYWDERFYRNISLLRDKDYNDTAIIDRFFKLKNNIGYIELVSMVDKEESPNFFEHLNTFMTEIKESEGLIIDVRENDGGSRHLIQELAGYIVNTDSIYVVNATKQRGKQPLNKKIKEELHYRHLFARNELEINEQKAVDKFMNSFKPMYDLNDDKFSEYHYYVLNGQKITKDKYHYYKPIYIVANERSFSAASILVSVFKGLPNVKIVGVNTDGSSGNSERFELPNSELRGKISTMVSFQKDGQLLDGIGTKPDIKIERNLDQIFWKEDYQINKIIELIKAQ